MVSLANLVAIALFVAIVLGLGAWVARRYALGAVLRRSAIVLRLDRSALLHAAIMLLGAAGVVIAFGAVGSPYTTAFVALSLLVGIAGATVALANVDWFRASRSLPVSTPGEAREGPVQIEGTVVDVGESTTSSVTQTDAVGYRAVTLSERAVLGRGYDGSVWSPVSTAADAVSFGLDEPDLAHEVAAVGSTTATSDVDPAVDVDGAAAEYPLLVPETRWIKFSAARRALDGLERSVPSEPGTTVPIGDDLGRGERPRPRRYTERRIDPGNEVYVLGTAEQTDDGVRIVDDPDGPPLIVARCSAAVAHAQARRLVVLGGLLGLLGIGGGLYGAGVWL